MRDYKLFLGGLTHATDDNMVYRHFSNYGPIIDVVVMFENFIVFVF